MLRNEFPRYAIVRSDDWNRCSNVFTRDWNRVVSIMSNLTIDVLKSVTPKKSRSMITEELVNKLNEWNEDPKLLEGFTDNVMSYIGVLKQGKYKVTDYMNAVRFVSYKLIGHSDIDAYIITFPERYQRLLDIGTNREDISPYVSAYKKNALVVQIFEQTIIPSHVLNAPMHQEALNELMRIGMNSRSDIARVNALSKVIDTTAPDKTAKIQLDISVNENSDAIADLRRATEELALQQLQSIRAGHAVKAIAESIIEVEVDDD